MNTTFKYIIGCFLTAGLVFGLLPSSAAAQYVEENEKANNTFSMACWAKPVIGEISPEQNTSISTGGISLSWEPATSTCSIAQLQYKLEVYGPSSELLVSTEWGNFFSYAIPEAQEGEYVWKLMVKDQFNNFSAEQFSMFTIDRTAPEVEFGIEGIPFTQQDSTYTVYARTGGTYKLTAVDADSAAYTEYRVNNGTWTRGNSIPLENDTVFTIEYKAGDTAGNISPVKVANVITDTVAPQRISNLTGTALHTSAIIIWTAPSDNIPDKTAFAYDIRYSTQPITEETFATATQLSGTPAPSPMGSSEQSVLSDLQPATTYFVAIQSIDKAGNRSALSNVLSVTTTPGVALQERSIVVNEVMWASSAEAVHDWLELYNPGTSPVDVTGLSVTTNVNGVETVLPLDTKNLIIQGGAYVLVTSDTNAVLAAQKDRTVAGLDFSSEHLSITIKDAYGTVIDTAGNGEAPFAGGPNVSMERVNSTLSGLDSTAWSSSSVGGSPKSRNTAKIAPEVSLTVNSVERVLGFSATHVSSYAKIKYLLTYDNWGAPAEGITGEIELSGENAVTRDGIVIGTCSSGTCVFDSAIQNVRLKLTFIDSENNELEVIKELP